MPGLPWKMTFSPFQIYAWKTQLGYGWRRTGISEVITEDTGDHIISEAEIEGSIRGANITEEDMGTTGLTGKTTAKRIALVGGGHAPVHPREGLLPQGLEVILEILISHHLIGRGGLPLG